MPAFYPIESGAVINPRRPIDGGAIRQKSVIRRTWTLAAQVAGDTFEGLTLPKGFKPTHLHIRPSATLGTSQLNVGITGTLSKYRAAAVVTTAAQGEAPVLIGTSVALAADEAIVITNSVATLPGSGTLEVEFEGTYE